MLSTIKKLSSNDLFHNDLPFGPLALEHSTPLIRETIEEYQFRVELFGLGLLIKSMLNQMDLNHRFDCNDMYSCWTNT